MKKQDDGIDEIQKEIDFDALRKRIDEGLKAAQISRTKFAGFARKNPATVQRFLDGVRKSKKTAQTLKQAFDLIVSNKEPQGAAEEIGDDLKRLFIKSIQVTDHFGNRMIGCRIELEDGSSLLFYGDYLSFDHAAALMTDCSNRLRRFVGTGPRQKKTELSPPDENGDGHPDKNT